MTKERRMRRLGHVARMGMMKNVQHFLLENTDAKKALGRSRLRMEDNLKIYPTEICLKAVDWIHWLSTGNLSVFF
jgi:hypothetical protein